MRDAITPVFWIVPSWNALGLNAWCYWREKGFRERLFEWGDSFTGKGEYVGTG